VESGQVYRFLCGADMEPDAIRAADPGARFVARARLVEPGGAGANAVWGILLATAAAGEDATGEVETDDGRRFAAGLATGGRPAGPAAAVLAAARYWELPPAYVARLAAASGEDPA
jgi:hypothetical protein